MNIDKIQVSTDDCQTLEIQEGSRILLMDQTGLNVQSPFCKNTYGSNLNIKIFQILSLELFSSKVLGTLRYELQKTAKNQNSNLSYVNILWNTGSMMLSLQDVNVSHLFA